MSDLKQGLCLDANIVIAALINEPDHEACVRVIELAQLANAPFFAPALLTFEVSSTLQRKVHDHELSKKQAKRALEIFIEFNVLVMWQDYVLTRALQFAQKLRLKNSYDAAYLAVASTRGIPLITLDEELIAKGKKIYKSIYTPRQLLAHSI